eukprot:707202-Alexandrium_andersonii.AAC.1
MAAEGIGSRGSAATAVQARPADDGGNPLVGVAARYINAANAEPGRWLRREGAVFGRKYARPSTRGAV